MKIILSNATSGKACTVYPRGEPVQFFQRKAYKISEHIFKRIVKTLCPKNDIDLHEINCDGIYRVIKWEHTHRVNNGKNAYYIEILNDK